jgi:cytochrome c oxidase cbb3-type subunit 3
VILRGLRPAGGGLVAIVAISAAAACSSGAAPAPDAVVVPPVTHAAVGPLPGPAADAEGPANPFAEDQNAQAEGRRYFLAYNCAGCHGEHGGGGMGPSLRDDVWLYGGTDAQIANSIAQGRAYGMPAWGRMLTDAQIWQIAAYLRTMRTDHEVDPPR